MPAGTEVTPIRFTAKGGNRLVRVRPGRRTTLSFRVPAGAAWSRHFRSRTHGYRGERAVSELAPPVRFAQSRGAIFAYNGASAPDYANSISNPPADPSLARVGRPTAAPL